jgi:hypothetical protein
VLRRKQEEHLEATDALEHGVRFVHILPILIVWDQELERARESCIRARRLWENSGYVMQQDTIILKILFLSALPLCLYTAGKKIGNLERDFIAPVPSVTPLLPVQGDFAGSAGGVPKLIFTGRKGQLIALDFFAKGAPNHNIVCGATTGAGKSFLVNFIAFNYYVCGALIRNYARERYGVESPETIRKTISDFNALVTQQGIGGLNNMHDIVQGFVSGHGYGWRCTKSEVEEAIGRTSARIHDQGLLRGAVEATAGEARLRTGTISRESIQPSDSHEPLREPDGAEAIEKMDRLDQFNRREIS